MSVVCKGKVVRIESGLEVYIFWIHKYMMVFKTMELGQSPTEGIDEKRRGERGR